MPSGLSSNGSGGGCHAHPAAVCGYIPANWRDVGVTLDAVVRAGEEALAAAAVPGGHQQQQQHRPPLLPAGVLLRGAAYDTNNEPTEGLHANLGRPRVMLDLRRSSVGDAFTNAWGAPTPQPGASNAGIAVRFLRSEADNDVEKYHAHLPRVRDWLLRTLKVLMEEAMPLPYTAGAILNRLRAIGPVYVHCRFGRDRTGIVVAFLLKLMLDGALPPAELDAAILQEFALTADAPIPLMRAALAGINTAVLPYMVSRGLYTRGAAATTPPAPVPPNGRPREAGEAAGGGGAGAGELEYLAAAVERLGRVAGVLEKRDAAAAPGVPAALRAPRVCGETDGARATWLLHVTAAKWLAVGIYHRGSGAATPVTVAWMHAVYCKTVVDMVTSATAAQNAWVEGQPVVALRYLDVRHLTARVAGGDASLLLPSQRMQPLAAGPLGLGAPVAAVASCPFAACAPSAYNPLLGGTATPCYLPLQRLPGVRFPPPAPHDVAGGAADPVGAVRAYLIADADANLPPAAPSTAPHTLARWAAADPQRAADPPPLLLAARLLFDAAAAARLAAACLEDAAAPPHPPPRLLPAHARKLARQAACAVEECAALVEG